MMMLLLFKVANTMQRVVREDRGSADNILPVFGYIVLSILILGVVCFILKGALPTLLQTVLNDITSNL